ncbi:SPFH domain-containing protein [Cohnella lubricantis]|uniref:SPFH domain-containing protein n=1 Tax=Cohnella lubricantis TaxID=2163172 RepID=A0A841TK57_9BACL|nr:SPFH domain-containing protein [Cohnella lubricantis]MBB6679317.1 SPFH domain-containing protein [Cohnella lubricantis]MBP2118744.1 membrane protease subunit (stomatin/prohibitin family) [Cohnella lubricantis]
MGLFDFLKGQFIEVIEWLDDSGSMVHRFPAYDNAIKMGAKLVVRESQAAIFVNEGQIADVFGPGTYTLSTQNMPVMTALRSWKHGFNSPFKADVFFVSMANFTNLKWGTTNPIIMRDAEFGVVRLRGFGTYSLRVKDPAVFLRALIGTQSGFTTDQIAGFFKSMLVTGITDLLGESNIPVTYLAASYEELSEKAMERVQPGFEGMGLELTLLLIENLSLPEEVEKAIDRRSAMGAVGNLEQYMKFQTAEAIREAANHPDGGAAGTGAGLGAGMAMAQMIGQMMNRPVENNAAAPAGNAPPAPATGGGGAISRTDDARVGAGADGSANSGADSGANDAARPPKRFCSECGEKLFDGAKFCSYCGTKA